MKLCAALLGCTLAGDGWQQDLERCSIARLVKEAPSRIENPIGNVYVIPRELPFVMNEGHSLWADMTHGSVTEVTHFESLN